MSTNLSKGTCLEEMVDVFSFHHAGGTSTPVGTFEMFLPCDKMILMGAVPSFLTAVLSKNNLVVAIVCIMSHNAA